MRFLAELTGLDQEASAGISVEGIGWIAEYLVGLDRDYAILAAFDFELAQLNSIPIAQRIRAHQIRQEALQLAKAKVVLARKSSSTELSMSHALGQVFAEEFTEWHHEAQQNLEDFRQLFAGRWRSSEYSRTFGLYPAICNSIYLSDPYASSAIVEWESNPGRTWLLRKLLVDAPSRDFEIETSLPPDLLKNKNYFKEIDKAEKVFADLQSLLGKVPKRTGRVTLRILEWDKSIFHSRNLGFFLDKGSFGVTLDKGLDDFAEDKLPRNLKLQSMSGSQLKQEQANLGQLEVILERTL